MNNTSTQDFVHETEGRNRRTFGAVIMVALLIIALACVNAMWWIMVLLALFAIPALLDLILNLKATLRLSDGNVTWKNRAQEGDVPFEKIEKVRFDGRFDLSVRVTLHTIEGKKVRLPYDVLPPSRTL